MRTGGWSRGRILMLWSIMAVVCALSSAAGYIFLSRASNHFLSVVDAFAGGAILMMLANTMIPEAYERAGKLAGVATVLGFAVAVLLVVFEHGGTV